VDRRKFLALLALMVGAGSLNRRDSAYGENTISKGGESMQIRDGSARHRRQTKDAPSAGRHPTTRRNTETPFDLPAYHSLDIWQGRAKQLREQILTSAGLLPFPERTRLRPRVLGRFEREGYVVENVYMETVPGLVLCGNLYRPLSIKPGVPAVLCPHGHDSYGRLGPHPNSSGPMRFQALARQGHVVFAYDMVGYDDTKPFGHWGLDRSRPQPPKFDGSRLQVKDGAWEKSWGISLMGLQLWNSIRALDFVESLPEVDPSRLACTGESGGGTQTYLLTAVDDRVKVSVPVCMVSAHFQGGCVCENGPSLRLEACNVEYAALAAPRPLLLISATGDWTRNTPQVEYPWVRSIYRLFGAEERVANAHQDAPHNYNAWSRMAAYRWLARWLLGMGDEQFDEFIRERRKAEYDELLDPAYMLVFYGQPRPRGVGPAVVTKYLVQRSEVQLSRRWPKTKSGLARLRRDYGPAYQRVLGASLPSRTEIAATESGAERASGATTCAVTMAREGDPDALGGRLLRPRTAGNGLGVLVVGGKTAAPAGADGEGQADPIAPRLARADCTVLAIDAPAAQGDDVLAEDDDPFIWTYNWTQAARLVQRILTAVTWLSGQGDVSRVAMVGLKGAGLCSLLARALAPQVDCCVADVERFDPADDAQFLKRLYLPLLRRVGDLRTATALSAPSRLFIHNTGSASDWRWLGALYRAAGRPDNVRTAREHSSAAEVMAFVLSGTDRVGRPRKEEARHGHR
jgi:dienelactone hydrolase